MGKAPAAQFARAKLAALKAIAAAEADAPVPDAVRFFDDDGFVVRLSHGEHHIQRAMTWTDVGSSKFDVIHWAIKTMLEDLANDFSA